MRPGPSSRVLVIGTVLPILIGPSPLPALQDGGSRRSETSTRESATFLLAPVGARSVGLGGAVAAARGEVQAIPANPAVAAAVERSEVYYLYGNDFATESHVFGGVWRSATGSLGVAWQRFDLGSLDATDSDGGGIGELALRNEALVLTLGLPLPSGVDAGISYKLVRFVSDCSGACGEFDLSSTGHAFDLGLTAAGRRHAVGIALRNAGAGLSIGEGAPSDPLPTRLRAGVALALLEPQAGRRGGGRPVGLSVSADLEETWTEFDDLDAFVGAELSLQRRLFARVGHAWWGRGRTGPSLGLGVRLDRLHLDVGRSFDDFAGFDGGAPLHLSVGVLF